MAEPRPRRDDAGAAPNGPPQPAGSALLVQKPQLDELLALSRELPPMAALGQSSRAGPMEPGSDLRWTPLDTPRPPRRLKLHELTPHSIGDENGRFFLKLSDLAELKTRSAAERGLRLMEQVPLEDRYVMADLTRFLLVFHGTLERYEDGLRALVEIALAVDTEVCWTEVGAIVPFHIWASTSPELRRWVTARLEPVCEQRPFAAPRMLLAFVLSDARKLEETPEAVPWLLEGLAAERWRRLHSYLGMWVRDLALSFDVACSYLRQAGRTEEERRVAAEIVRFPWQRHLDRFGVLELRGLAITLAHTKRTDDLERLLRRLWRAGMRGPQLEYWLGWLGWVQRDIATATTRFTNALEQGLSDEPTLVNVATFAETAAQTDLLRRISPAIRELNEPLYWKCEIALATRERVPQRTVEACEKLAELEPINAARLHDHGAALLYLRRDEELRQLAEPFIGAEDRLLDAVARCQLSTVVCDSGRHDEACALIEPLLGDGGLEAELQEQDLLEHLERCVSTVMLTAERYEEGLVWLQRLAKRRPSPHVVHDLCAASLELGRESDALKFLQEGLAQHPESPSIRYTEAAVLEELGRWPELLVCLEEHGAAWFDDDGRAEWALTAKLRALLEVGRAFDALDLCEERLDAVLENEELRELRGEILACVREEFQAMETTLEARDRALAKTEQQRRKLANRLGQRKRQLDSLRSDVHRLEARRRELVRQVRDTEAGPAPEPEMPDGLDAERAARRAHPELRAALPARQQRLLDGAELLWQKLAEHPEQDHGPVVLQLARVVEGEVNRLLVDPLVALAAGRDVPLHNLTTGRLQERGNRLSLGEAQRLLYHRAERRNADGSVQAMLNPRSDEAHRQLLEEFWDERRHNAPPRVDSSLPDDLPFELEELARVRNRAGHHGDPIERREAARVRDALLSERGLLLRLSVD